MINDNDFQTVYDGSTGAFSVGNKPTLYSEYGAATPPPVVPEAPWVPLMLLTGLLTGGIAVVTSRRQPAVV